MTEKLRTSAGSCFMWTAKMRHLAPPWRDGELGAGTWRWAPGGEDSVDAGVSCGLWVCQVKWNDRRIGRVGWR